MFTTYFYRLFVYNFVYIYRNSSAQQPKSGGNPVTNVTKDTHVPKNSPPVQKKAKVLIPKQSAIDKKLKVLMENQASSKIANDDVELVDENSIRNPNKGHIIFCGICDEGFGNQEIAKTHMKSQYGIKTYLTVRNGVSIM